MICPNSSPESEKMHCTLTVFFAFALLIYHATIQKSWVIQRM